MDVGNGCGRIGVDLDTTVHYGDTSRLKTKFAQPRASPRGHQHPTAGQTQAIRQLRREVTWLTGYSRHGLFKHNVDAAVLHPFEHRIGQLCIEAPQQAFARTTWVTFTPSPRRMQRTRRR